MRWALKLAEYRFTIKHKPGALHKDKDADGISRLVAYIDLDRRTYINAVQALNPSRTEFESSRKARTRTTTACFLQAAQTGPESRTTR